MLFLSTLVSFIFILFHASTIWSLFEKKLSAGVALIFISENLPVNVLLTATDGCSACINLACFLVINTSAMTCYFLPQ